MQYFGSRAGYNFFTERVSGYLNNALGNFAKAREHFERADPMLFDPATWERAIWDDPGQGCYVAWIMSQTGDGETGAKLLAASLDYYENELPRYVEHPERGGAVACHVLNGDMVAGTFVNGAPSIEANDFTRADFAAALPVDAATAPSVLMRIRRAGDNENIPGTSSSGARLPFLFAQGSVMSFEEVDGYSARRDGIAMRAVARNIVTIPKLRPVRLQVALVVAPDCSQHGWPGFANNQVSALIRSTDRLAGFIDDIGIDSRQRAGA